MKLLLLNDTRTSPNPGCQAASTATVEMFSRLLGAQEVRSVPLGTWAEQFRPLAVLPAQVVSKEPGMLPCSLPTAPDVDVDAWAERRRALAESDGAVREMLRWADQLVVNGEGSIHHNFPRALALLALCRTALDLGRPVHLVNSTIQAMDTRLLSAVVPDLTTLHVREPASHATLQGLHNNVRVSADFAFAAPFESEARPTSATIPKNACLLTSGVLANPATLESQVATIRAATFSPVYFSAGDGGEDSVAQSVCTRLSVPFVLAKDMDWRGIVAWVREFPVAVSGRHHINIFLMLAGVPFVPLRSNTWKIESTLKLVSYPVVPAVNLETLGSSLTKLSDDRERYAQASSAAGATGKDSVREFEAAWPQ